MKSTKTFNNIPDELKKQIPRLQPGQVVTFQMLNGTPNPEPDERERAKNPILYGKVQIKTNHRIYYNGEYFDIGCVDSWKGDEPDRFRLFVPGMGEYTHFQGKFSLTGGNAKDEELYEILWLSPEREGTPCPDNRIPKVFKILDLKAESKSAVNKIDKLRKALDVAKNMTVEQAVAVMAALNQPTYTDTDVLLSKVAQLAKDKTDVFLAAVEDKDTPLKGEIKSAIDAGVLDYDFPTGAVKLGDLKLTVLRLDSSESFVSEFAKFVNTAENGKDVMANVRKQLAAKQSVTA